MRVENGQQSLIGQLRQNARIIELNISMITNALEGTHGSSIDSDYRPTTQIWLAELRGMRNFTSYMLGEMTFGEMLEDANMRTRERYDASLGTYQTTTFPAQRTIEAYAEHVSGVRNMDMEGVRF